MVTKKSIPQIFSDVVQSFPDDVLFHYGKGGWNTVTYREFSKEVQAVASHLLRNGLQKGDRVSLIAENRLEWCAAYLSIVSAGGIAVPLDAQLGSAEITNLTENAESRIIFCSEATRTSVTVALERLKEKGRDTVLINMDTPEYRDILQTDAVDAFPDVRAEDIASIIYTSGTTGSPKGVMLTQANFCSDAEAAIQAGIVSQKDNVLSILPLHHTYAFMCTFLVPLFLGASITYPESLKGPDMMAAIRDREVTILIGVPQVLALIRGGIMRKINSLPTPVPVIMHALLRISGFIRGHFRLNLGRIVFRSAHRALGSQFRFFGSGGARLDPEIMRDLEALGFTVLEGYGLTETSPIVTFNPLEKRKPGSAGKPFHSVEIQILTPSDSGEGEIAIKGPMVMKGYYKNPLATGEVLKNGWFMTGDIGRIDKDGYLFITGRSKEVIVLSSGKNIYPEEVEKHYLDSPLIKEICVLGREEKGLTESLHAVIVPDLEYAKTAGISDIRETIKWEISDISGRLAPYMRVRGYILLSDPLPRTPLGKLRRFMVKDLIAGKPEKTETEMKEEADVFESTASQKVREALQPFLKGAQKISPDDNLELDLGLDSLSKIELLVALERLFNLKLPEDFISDIHTVRELTEKIETGTAAGYRKEKIEQTGWKGILLREPPEEELKGLLLEKPKRLTVPTFIIFQFLKILMKVFFRLEARGVGNIPHDRNYVITPNHTSYLDGFVVILSLPYSHFRNIYTLGLSRFFTGFLKGWFAQAANVIPIDTTSYLNKALQMSAYVVRKERSLMVFPEGGRAHDGRLMEFKKGIGILAVETGITAVPTQIKGAFGALPRGARWPAFRKIIVTFGKPLGVTDIDFSKKPDDMDTYQYFADVLRERVKALGRENR